uniref:Uncharacterized protein n=1 Tax=Anopheles culicifacies TaxID=139723 RepID=A0A182MAA2_9DIPT
MARECTIVARGSTHVDEIDRRDKRLCRSAVGIGYFIAPSCTLAYAIEITTQPARPLIDARRLNCAAVDTFELQRMRRLSTQNNILGTADETLSVIRGCSGDWDVESRSCLPADQKMRSLSS